MPPGNDEPGPTGTVAEAPTCYRHPGREAHLRCTRCDRTICPECMVQASVGFQCPECVKLGNRNVRPARTVLGGVARQSFVPVVTYVLIALNVAMFGLQQIVDTPVVGSVDTFELRLGLLPKYWHEGQPIGVTNGEWYRFVTSMFVHAGFAHIAMNMISLFFIGPMLEMMIGRLRFALVYLVGGLAGGATSYFFMTNLSGPSVGASGAISAVFGCLIVIGLRRRILNANSIVVVLVLNVFLTVQSPNIDWHDHLGGIVAGAVMGAVFAYGPEILRAFGKTSTPAQQQAKFLSTLQFATMALVLAVSVGASAAHTADLNDPANRVRSAGGPPSPGALGKPIPPTAPSSVAKIE